MLGERRAVDRAYSGIDGHAEYFSEDEYQEFPTGASGASGGGRGDANASFLANKEAAAVQSPAGAGRSQSQQRSHHMSHSMHQSGYSATAFLLRRDSIKQERPDQSSEGDYGTSCMYH